MTKLPRLGLMSTFLLLSAACSSQRANPPLIPEMLLAPCPEPQWEGETNGDLIDYIADLKEALGKCNADKAAIYKIIDGRNQ